MKTGANRAVSNSSSRRGTTLADFIAVALIIVTLAAVLFPVFTQARNYSGPSCLSNVKQQITGMQMYAQNNDSVLPPTAQWMDDLYPYIKSEQVYHCPDLYRDKTAYGYAYNSRLSAARIPDIFPLSKYPKGKVHDWVAATTPLVYDSTNLVRNATDPFTSVPLAKRHHFGGNNIGYVDGHVHNIVAISKP